MAWLWSHWPPSWNPHGFVLLELQLSTLSFCSAGCLPIRLHQQGALEGDRRQGSGEGAGPFLRASWLASYAPGPLPLDPDAGRWVRQQLVPVSGPFPTPSSSPISPPLRAFSPGPAAVPSRRSQFCSPSPKPLGLMTPTSSLCLSSPWLWKLLPALIIPFLFQGLPYTFGVLQYLFNQFLILNSLC